MRLLLFLLLTTAGFAQTDYFQQEVDYTMRLRLNDSLHTLEGDYELTYTNRSPDALPFLYFHLWPNAFQNSGTAYARQELRNGDTRFEFADPKYRGGIDVEDWTVNGAVATFQPDSTHLDYGKLYLPEPLAPGASVTIRAQTRLQIPGSFSRLGRVGTSYQMTQWYPKPAVYDRAGWHPMPYLDQGEFYSEFGNFDVTITLPANYVVAASGELQTPAERTFLQEKMRETDAYFAEVDRAGTELPRYQRDSFPASAAERKTIRYVAEQVHDFAWFADKRFLVDADSVTLSNGAVVNTWTFYTKEQAGLWRDAIDYVNRSTLFYSEEVGNYPWPQATAVQSALSAGGGMEYPMITVIGQAGTALDLDEVITHEVGHNWFYGILASNERPYAWMDEGWNSFYEGKYMERHYGQGGFDRLVPQFFRKQNNEAVTELFYLFLARLRRDQAPNTPSDELTSLNYGLGAYSKPAAALKHLEAYLGEERFADMMQTYYGQWKFKHPQPEDLRRVFEDISGEDLNWFFDGLLYSNKKLDYRLQKSEQRGGRLALTIENKGEIDAPFALGTRAADSTATNVVWYPGIAPGEMKTINYNLPDGAEVVYLDPANVTMELYRRGDQVSAKGKQQTPFSLQLFRVLENTRAHSWGIAPWLGYNLVDGVQPGLALYNLTATEKPFEFFLAPQFGLSSGDVTGIADARLNLYPGRDGQKLTLGLNARTFNYREVDNGPLNFRQRYARIQPDLTWSSRATPTAARSHELFFRPVLLLNQAAEFSVEGEFLGVGWQDQTLLRAGYETWRRDAINPSSLSFLIEQRNYTGVFGGSENYLNLQGTWESKYVYKRGRSLNFRAFAGYFLDNSQRDTRSLAPGFFALTMNSWADDFDYLFLGRPTDDTRLYRQIYRRDAGFKNAFPAPFANQAGGSNHFMLAFNFSADLPERLPLGLPIRPYLDIAYSANRHSFDSESLTFGDQIWFSGGLSLEFADGLVGIYFPLLNSNNIDRLYDQDGVGRTMENDSRFTEFLSRVTFMVDFQRLNPVRFRDRLDL